MRSLASSSDLVIPEYDVNGALICFNEKHYPQLTQSNNDLPQATFLNVLPAWPDTMCVHRIQYVAVKKVISNQIDYSDQNVLSVTV